MRARIAFDASVEEATFASRWRGVWERGARVQAFQFNYLQWCAFGSTDGTRIAMTWKRPGPRAGHDGRTQEVRS